MTFTRACGKARCLTYWTRPGIEPVSSWMLLMRFVSTEPGQETRHVLYRKLYKDSIKKSEINAFSKLMEYKINTQKYVVFPHTNELSEILWKQSHWSSCCGTKERTLIRNHEVVGSILDIAQWVSHPALLWAVVWSQTQLRCHIAVAVAKASSYISDLTPSLGTSICRGCGPPEKRAISFTIASKRIKYLGINI